MTMRDIAQILGVSVATVSRALNNNENVSAETKKRVQELAKELVYTTNATARNLSKKDTRTIAVLVPNIKNQFFANLIDTICKYFYEDGYRITLYNSSEDLSIEESAIQNILEQRVNGVIAILIKSNYKTNPILCFDRFKIPCILLDRELEDSSTPGIFLDNFRCSYNITKKLIEEGHSNIAIITGSLDLKTAFDRLEGYKQAHKDLNIPIDNKNILLGDFTLESGYNAGIFLAENLNCTAIYASNNVMLVGAIKALKEKNRSLRLACFESLELLEILDYKILSYDIPMDIMGKKAFELLKNNLKEKIYIEPIMKG